MYNTAKRIKLTYATKNLVLDTERMNPRREPLRQHNENVEKQSIIGHESLKGSDVRQQISRDSARLQNSHERNMAGVK